MADTPSDGTPDATTPPPPRRRTRGEPASAKGSRAKAPAKRASAGKAAAAKVAKPVVAKKAVAAPKAAPKKATAAKPRAKASVPVAAPEPRKAGIGKILAIGAAATAALAAGLAAILGRKKIATVSTDTIDAVMGKSEPATPADSKDLKSAD